MQSRMFWRNGVEKRGDSPMKEFLQTPQKKRTVCQHAASFVQVFFFGSTTPIWGKRPQSGEALPKPGKNRATPTLSQSKGKLGNVHNGSEPRSSPKKAKQVRGTLLPPIATCFSRLALVSTEGPDVNMLTNLNQQKLCVYNFLSHTALRASAPAIQRKEFE